MIKAQEHCCEEAAMGMGDAYIPCNKPATKVIRPRRDGSEPDLRMCDACADHSVRNRGMILVGPYTRPGSSYQFWTDSLAGKKPPIVNEYPQAGFYRMKRGKNGPWVPVAVWPKSLGAAGHGLGFKIGAEVVERDFGIEQWPYYAAHPITEAVYRAVAERGQNWPDADPVVAAIQDKHSVPSNGNVKAETSDPVTDLKEQITAALGGVAAYAKIETEEANTRAAGLRNMLMKLSGDAEKDGKALYEPHYREYKKLYDQWNPLVKLAADGAVKLRRSMEKYQDDKRAAAAEAERRAEAERQRIERERIEAEIQAQIDGKPSPEPVERAPVVVQSNMPAPDVQVRPTFGKAANVGTRMEVTSIDTDKFLAALKARAEWGQVEGFLLELAQKMANKGIVLPGVTAKERSAIK